MPNDDLNLSNAIVAATDARMTENEVVQRKMAVDLEEVHTVMFRGIAPDYLPLPTRVMAIERALEPLGEMAAAIKSLTLWMDTQKEQAIREEEEHKREMEERRKDRQWWVRAAGSKAMAILIGALITGLIGLVSWQELIN